MAVESYDQIMARLNNPYGYAPTQPKTPASDFTSYVQTLLSEPNPQGGMFRMQDEIDERRRKAKEEEEAKARALAGGLGMFNQVSGGSESGGGVTLTPEQIAFLDRETPEERYARITGDWFGLKPIGATMLGGLGGLNAYLNQQTPTYNDMLFKADIYNKTPSLLQGILPDAYKEAANSANIMETGTPYEEITPTFDWSSSGDSSSTTSSPSYSPSEYAASIASTGESGFYI